MRLEKEAQVQIPIQSWSSWTAHSKAPATPRGTAVPKWMGSWRSRAALWSCARPQECAAPVVGVPSSADTPPHHHCNEVQLLGSPVTQKWHHFRWPLDLIAEAKCAYLQPLQASERSLEPPTSESDRSWASVRARGFLNPRGCMDPPIASAAQSWLQVTCSFCQKLEVTFNWLQASFWSPQKPWVDAPTPGWVQRG